VREFFSKLVDYSFLFWLAGVVIVVIAAVFLPEQPLRGIVGGFGISMLIIFGITARIKRNRKFRS